MREGFVSDNQFEIPKAVRDLAEQNMKQAQTAYGQLTNFVTSGHEHVDGHDAR